MHHKANFFVEFKVNVETNPATWFSRVGVTHVVSRWAGIA